MIKILGVDPGSRKTGFGVVSYSAGRSQYMASGVIKMSSTHSLPERLSVIFSNLQEVIELYSPTHFAIESVFLSKNASSALKLGQARGAAIVAATNNKLPVFEYEARKVKQSVVGNGAADKIQVQHMVTSLLKLDASPQEDAADALAVALCHISTVGHLTAISKARTFRRGRLV